MHRKINRHLLPISNSKKTFSRKNSVLKKDFFEAEANFLLATSAQLLNFLSLANAAVKTNGLGANPTNPTRL
jgi:hypothetical protein